MKEHEEAGTEEYYGLGVLETIYMSPDAEMGYPTEYALEVIEKYKDRIASPERMREIDKAAREANLKRKREREEKENKDDE